MKATKQQLIAAVEFCAEGRRFTGDCPRCPLSPYRDWIGGCTSCVERVLRDMLDYLKEETHDDPD